jgi:hypothetical protein
MVSAQPTCFVLVGARFTGKSALLRHLLHHPHGLAPPSSSQAEAAEGVRLEALRMALVDCAWFTSESELLAALLAALPTHPHPPMPGTPPPAPTLNGHADLQALLCTIHQAGEHGQPVALLLDNLDGLLRQLPQPVGLYTALQRLATRATLILTSEQPLYDLHNSLREATLFSGATHLFLGQIEAEAAQQWVADYQSQFPGLANMAHALVELTGRHPFLLAKLGDSLREVQQMWSGGQMLQASHLPLIHLRLSEHARPLLASLRQKLHDPPDTIPSAVLHPLLAQLQRSPLTPSQLTPDQWPVLNWLINQALITIAESPNGIGYRFFSPLLSEFLRYHPVEMPTAAGSVALPHPTEQSIALYDRLTKIEANLLHYFQAHSQTLIPTEQLLTDVWKRPSSSDRRVQEAIRRLRLQLEQQHPPIGEIKNERGRGYRFVPVHHSQLAD